MASGPPSVPKSRMAPFFQTNPCVWVVKQTAKQPSEKGSGIKFENHPATCPRPLIAAAKLSCPPCSVPRSSMVLLLVQTAARFSGIPRQRIDQAVVRIYSDVPVATNPADAAAQSGARKGAQVGHSSVLPFHRVLYQTVRVAVWERVGSGCFRLACVHPAVAHAGHERAVNAGVRPTKRAQVDELVDVMLGSLILR